MPLHKPPCLEEGCPNRSVARGYCEKHKPKAFAKNRRRERLPDDWGTLRRQVLTRDNWICYMCGGSGADGVDHLVANDDDSLDNLKAVHHNVYPFCHRQKTAQEAYEARKAQAPVESNTSLIERAKSLGII